MAVGNFKNDSFYRPVVFTILVLALITRFYRIDAHSLWLDEGFSIRAASLPFEQMLDKSLPDPNPPLYPIMLHFWVKLFGDSEISGRTLSAIVNVLSIPLIIGIGEMLFNRRIAVYTAVIFLLSPFQLYYAQEIRAYSLLSFLSLVSIFFFMKLCGGFKYRQVGSGQYYRVVYVISTTALLYTHVYGWFILFLENFWMIYLRKRRKALLRLKKFILLQCWIFLLFLPYGMHFMGLVFNVQREFWINRPTFLHLAGTFAQFSGSPALFVYFCLIILLFMPTMLKTRFLNLRGEALLFLLLWIGLLVAVPFLLSQILTPFYLTRYPVAASIPFYFLVAVAMNARPSRRIRRIALIFLIVLSVFYLYQYYHRASREPWRRMVAELKADAGEEDLVLLVSDIHNPGNKKKLNLGITRLANDSPDEASILGEVDYSIPDIFIYYAGKLSQPVLGISREQVENDSLNQQLMNELKRPGKPVWFVSSHFSACEQTFLSQLKNYFVIEDTKSYYYYDLYNRRMLGIRVYKIIPRRNHAGN